MALLIGNMSIQPYYCESFPLNNPFPLQPLKFFPLKDLPCTVVDNYVCVRIVTKKT